MLDSPSFVAAQSADSAPVVEAEKMVVQDMALGGSNTAPTVAVIGNGEPSLSGSWNQVTSQVPNLGIDSAGVNSFGAVYSLRGLSNTPYFSEPAVTLYFDDIPMGVSLTYPTDLFGFSSASVYAGPQPTVFGKAGDGGVIILSPTSGQGPGEVLFGLGNYDSRSGAIEAEMPEGTHADGFVAAAFSQRDGFISNTQLGQAVDSVHALESFAKERFRPTSKSELTFEVLADRHRDGAAPIVPLDGPLYTVERSQEGVTNTDFFGAALRGVVDVDAVRFTAVTSYTDSKLNPYDDWIVVPPPIQSSITESQRIWSEELHLSPIHNGVLSWNLGSWLSYGATMGAADRTIGGTIPFEVSGYGFTRHEAAIFGDITIVPAEHWLLSIGGRVQQVEKTYQQNQEVPGPDLHLNFARDDGAFLPHLAATFDPSALTSVTASATEGSRPGGFSAYTDNPSLIPFPAEHVAAFEAGLRRASESRAFDFSIRAFDYEIGNYQIERSFSTANYLVATAPKARSFGAEFKVDWKPSAGWTIGLFEGNTDVTLFNFVDPVTKISSSGKRAPYAPIFTSGINIGFRSARGWFASGNIAAAGKTFYTETEDPRFAQGAYAVVGARAGFESRRWSITAYVANACDKSYYSQIIPAVNSASPGAPRTMGSELMVRF